MKLGENIMRQSLECQEYPPPLHHPPWSFISNFKIKSKEIVFVFPPVFYHGNGSRISFGLIAVYDWSFIQRWLTIWPSMTCGIAVKFLRSLSDCQDPVWSKINPLPLLWLCSDHPLILRHYANQNPKLRVPPWALQRITIALQTPNDLGKPRSHFCPSCVFIIPF